METIWHYLINQFLTATQGNYKKALKLSNYHHAFLNRMMLDNPSDPDWATLYSRYDPFHQGYVSAYSTWKLAGGEQKGQTLNVDQLLKLLVSRVASWDIQVQSQSGFEKGTPAYLSIFPQGRRPFSHGAKVARMTAVDVLGKKLANTPPFPALGAIVTAFYAQLDSAGDTQESAKGITKMTSTEVELRRVEVMTEQYRNLGFLINKGAEEAERIAPFFDLNVLRDSDQVRFTGTLDPAETEPVLIHTFASDDELEITIKADPATPAGTMVQFYLSTVAGGTTGTPVQAEANAGPLTITAAAFGATNYGTHRFLTAVNTNAVELQYVVELD